MIHHRYDSVDASALNRTDRLGLAYCRLINYEWDEILGPKPEGFDTLPKSDHKAGRPFHRRIRSKKDYIRPAYQAIESIIGEANTSRCWCKFVLGRSEEAWFQWYTVERFLSLEERRTLRKQRQQ